MATQTESGMGFTQAEVFCSPDGTTWTEMSGHGAAVSTGGGERATGEQNTFAGVTPIVAPGDRAASELTVRFVYTETEAEPFEVAKTAHESATGAWWTQYRIKPLGVWYTTGAGVITNLVYPQGEAGPGTVVMSEYVMKCAAITEAAAST